MFRRLFSIPPKGKRALALVYTVLRLSVIAVLVAQILNRNFMNVFTCALTLLLFMVPSFLERRIKIDVPDTLEIIVLLFVYSAEILGEIRDFYISYPYWDTILHTTNGFMMGAIGLSMITLLNKDRHAAFSLSPVFVALVTFCFSMTIGVLWEFLEFSADRLLGTDMQKDTFVNVVNTVLLHPDRRNIVVSIPVESVIINGETWQGYIDIGLFDTVKDMFVNFLGAVVFSVIGYFNAKGAAKTKFVEKLVLSRINSNQSGKDTSENSKEE